MAGNIDMATARNIVLVGCGNMGFALLRGWLANAGGLRVHVVEPAEELRLRAGEQGATTSATGNDMPAGFDPDVVVMAVKPHHVCELLPQYAHLVKRGAFILSVAAGVTIDSMQSALGVSGAIVRCMPNTPCAIGAGALVCCLSPQAGQSEELVTRQLLSTSGEVFFVDQEDLMDAVTAVSGSGPAYIFNFIECLTDAALAAGLPDDLAKALALQTVYGASMLAKASDQPAGVLRRQVTSPSGTTAAALSVLMAPNGLAPVIAKAVMAAKERSIELGRQ